MNVATFTVPVWRCVRAARFCGFSGKLPQSRLNDEIKLVVFVAILGDSATWSTRITTAHPSNHPRGMGRSLAQGAVAISATGNGVHSQSAHQNRSLKTDLLRGDAFQEQHTRAQFHTKSAPQLSKKTDRLVRAAKFILAASNPDRILTLPPG